MLGVSRGCRHTLDGVKADRMWICMKSAAELGLSVPALYSKTMSCRPPDVAAFGSSRFLRADTKSRASLRLATAP